MESLFLFIVYDETSLDDVLYVVYLSCYVFPHEKDLKRNKTKNNYSEEKKVFKIPFSHLKKSVS
jgi:hypothetical protein